MKLKNEKLIIALVTKDTYTNTIREMELKNEKLIIAPVIQDT